MLGIDIVTLPASANSSSCEAGREEIRKFGGGRV